MEAMVPCKAHYLSSYAADFTCCARPPACLLHCLPCPALQACATRGTCCPRWWRC